MDIAVTILQKEGGEKISAASVKGNPGKTNKLGSFKQAMTARSYLCTTTFA